MKTLATILLTALIITSCSNNDPEIEIETRTVTVYTTNVINETNVIVQTNDVIIPTGPIDFLTYEDETIYAVRYGNKTELSNVKASYAGNFSIAISNVLYYLDNNGNITSSKWLPTTPDHITIVGEDIYIVKDISKEYSLSQGGLYKEHSEIWKNNATINHWSMNQFKTIDLFTAIDAPMIKKSDHTFKDISDIHNNVKHADENIIVYDILTSPNSGNFRWNDNSYFRSFTYNYLLNSRSYIISDGSLLSSYDHRIDADGTFHERQTPIDQFNTNYRVISVLASRYENGEYCDYYLNCNNGDIYRYIPSINNLSIVYDLYDYEYNNSTAIGLLQNLKTEYIYDVLYFEIDGVRWQWNFTEEKKVFSGPCLFWN